MFSKWSLKKKLVGAFMTVASVIVMVGLVTNFYLRSVTESYSYVAKIVLPTLGKLGDMREDIDEEATLLARLGNEKLSAHHPQYAKDVEKSYDSWHSIEAEYLKIEFMPGEEELYKAFHAEAEKTDALVKKLKVLGVDERPGAEVEYSRLYSEEFVPQSKLMTDRLNELSNHDSTLSDKFSKMAEASAQQLSIVNIILTFIGFALSIALGLLSASTISNSLQRIIESISGSSVEVASASEQISSSSVELSESSTEQASAIQETASALEEVTAMIVRNSDNAKTSQTTSQGSREAAEEGQRAATEMINTINEINVSNENIITKVEESNKRIGDIVLVINEISNKTKVINDIVFQTKLLSFNASVEAARAGEHGKGFAVVAEEVGNLAQMSGNAAEEISGMLEESVKKVEAIVNETKGQIGGLMVESRRKVVSGNDAAKKCGNTLGEILEKVQQVDGLVSQIVTASSEQSQGIQEINKAMAQLDTATAQNSAVSQHTASASEQLSAQSHNLNGLIMDLRALITGNREDTGEGQSTGAKKKKGLKIASAKSEGGRVVPMPKKKATPAAHSEGKLVVNGQAYPSASDPRFEEF